MLKGWVNTGLQIGIEIRIGIGIEIGIEIEIISNIIEYVNTEMAETTYNTLHDVQLSISSIIYYTLLH